MARKMQSVSVQSIKPNSTFAQNSGTSGALALHVNLQALHSMQGRDERDDVSSPIYPFDSGVEDNSDLETTESSHKSFHGNGFHGASKSLLNDSTCADFAHNGTLAREKTRALALNVSLDLPDAYGEKTKRRFADKVTHKKQARLRHQLAPSRPSKGARESDSFVLSQRSSNSCDNETNESNAKAAQKSSDKKNLQWMNFKSCIKSDTMPSRLHREQTTTMSRHAVRQNTVSNSDEWAIIEKEMRRYEAHGHEALRSFVKSVSMAHNMNRLDWRMLAQSLGQDDSSNGDFFSIYSWSTRKNITETHPLTAYVKQNTDITSEQLHKDLHIGKSSSACDKAQRRQSKRNVPGPSGGKYMRTPRGYNFKKEKTKTPGEVAIAEARVKNSVGKENGYADARLSAELTRSREGSVLLPDIHLPRHRAQRENLFGRFIPGKTIRSQANKSADGTPVLFDCPLQVKTFAGLPAPSTIVGTSTGSSIVSSFDDILPMLPANQRTSLVGVDSAEEELSKTLNTSSIVPVPRMADKKHGQQVALTYQSLYRKGTPPKPPPATPVSHIIVQTNDFYGQHETMSAERPLPAHAPVSPPACDYMAVTSPANSPISSLSSVGRHNGDV